MSDYIYLDHAATTALDPRVLAAMQPFFTEKFANPSSIYALGRQAKAAIEDARQRVAELLGVQSKEIFFTASGSEADNWALKGVALANQERGRHIITSSIEHHAVLRSCKTLEQLGFTVTYLPVDELGLVNPTVLAQAIRPETTLVSLMLANNEIGTIQPIADLARITRAKNIYFHSDAVQAAGVLALNIPQLGVDLLSLSAHKFYGPKGVGLLYIRDGVQINKLLDGGAQERDLRAGTENVAGIVGLARALELAVEDLAKQHQHLLQLRQHALARIEEEIPATYLNGPRGEQRLPGNLNFSFAGVSAEQLLMLLDQAGIAASSASACSAGSLEPSHVLLALGLSPERAQSSLRLTFGRDNTLAEVDQAIDKLKKIVRQLRKN